MEILKLAALLLCLTVSPAWALTRTSVATEDFSGTLSNWTSVNPLTATPTITGGQASCAHSGECASRYTGAGSFSDDQYATADIIFGGAAANNYTEVMARVSAQTDGNRDYFACQVADDNGTGTATRAMKAIKVTNGTRTQIGSTSSTSWTSNHTMTIEVSGASGAITVSCFHNSTEEITVTGETTLSTGKPGYGMSNMVQRLDNWIGGDLTAPTGYDYSYRRRME
jgi:hypothetical protein